METLFSAKQFKIVFAIPGTMYLPDLADFGVDSTQYTSFHTASNLVEGQFNIYQL